MSPLWGSGELASSSVLPPNRVHFLAESHAERVAVLVGRQVPPLRGSAWPAGSSPVLGYRPETALMLFSFLAIVCIVVAAAIAVGVSVVRTRRRRIEIDTRFPVGSVRIFEGVYFSHWEIARFEWHVGDVIGRGLDRHPLCSLETSEEVAKSIPRPLTRSEAPRRRRLVFKGAIIEKGHFGHRGICSYRVRVDEVLEAFDLEGQ